jgi:uncharacterized protein YjbI with pentapeptide repeats
MGLRRSIGRGDLQRRIAAHQQWLRSQGGDGERAHLAGFDLADADFSGVDLRGADFSSSRLRSANFHGACLAGATFAQADLRGADFGDATLAGADFVGANLLEVTGLTTPQLGGTILASARLPEGMTRFETVGRIEKAAESAQKLYLVLLAGCAYALLTILSTKDATLLSNAPSLVLPNFSTPIPTAGFYQLWPFVLLGLYVYLHLHLQPLWQALPTLPTVFPDGRRAEEVVPPSLLVASAPLPSRRSASPAPALVRAGYWSVAFSLWWLVPLVLAAFWVRYLPMHDVGWTYAQAALACFAFGLAVHLLGFTRQALDPAPPLPLSPGCRGRRRRSSRRGCIAVLVVGGCLAMLSYGATHGVRYDLNASSQPGLGAANPRRWAPRILRWFGVEPFANFEKADVSVKPAVWSNKEPDYLAVRGAPLAGRDLAYALAREAFLLAADLRRADLEHADLHMADLRHANLAGANLSGADLSEARLTAADLTDAELFGTRLHKATLDQAKLIRARFADQADLSGADLTDAEVQGCSLGRGINLKGAHIDRARLSAAHLTDADLTNAWLTNAVLVNATFTNADLGGAHLAGANLTGADLRQARNLTQTQLDEATYDITTQLPAGLKRKGAASSP